MFIEIKPRLRALQRELNDELSILNPFSRHPRKTVGPIENLRAPKFGMMTGYSGRQCYVGLTVCRQFRGFDDSVTKVRPISLGNF